MKSYWIERLPLGVIPPLRALRIVNLQPERENEVISRSSTQLGALVRIVPVIFSGFFGISGSGFFCRPACGSVVPRRSIDIMMSLSQHHDACAPH